MSLLEIEDLVVHFDTDAGPVQAVDGVGLNVEAGEIIGLVGESGSGKSVTGLAILGLIRPPGRIVRGAVRFEGNDIVRMTEAQRRALSRAPNRVGATKPAHLPEPRDHRRRADRPIEPVARGSLA